jgi:hypothetical protein
MARDIAIMDYRWIRILILFLPMAPRDAQAQDTFTMEARASEKVRDGKALIEVAGTSNLPKDTIFKGNLAYVVNKQKFDFKRSYRVDIQQDGSFTLPFPATFLGPVIPGHYEITIEADASQPPHVYNRVNANILRSLKRTIPLQVGTPEAARATERKRRGEWREAYVLLGRLGEELSEAFRLQLERPFNAETWQTWMATWRDRLQKLQKLDLTKDEFLVLNALNPSSWSSPNNSMPGDLRDRIIVLLLDIVGYCDSALRHGRNEGDVRRVRDWLQHYQREYDNNVPNLPLMSLGEADALDLLNSLRTHLKTLKTWMDGRERKSPERDMEEWRTWSATWASQVGGDLNRLLIGDRRAERLEAAHGFAMKRGELEAAAHRVVSGTSDPSALIAALDEARRALDRLESQWKKKK